MSEAKMPACPKCKGTDIKSYYVPYCWVVRCDYCKVSIHGFDQEHAERLWREVAGGRQPDAIQTPKPSTLASATCYASWVIVLNAKREPIVKRCDSQAAEIKMMKAMRKMNPNATVIHAQLNPGDHNELWATSEAHWLAVSEA